MGGDLESRGERGDDFVDGDLDSVGGMGYF